MSPPAKSGRAVSRKLRREQEARLRRVAVVGVLAAVALGTLLVTAFGGGDHPAASLAPPASPARLLPVGPPNHQVIARLGSNLSLELPVNENRVTAIGYFGAEDGSIALSPVGTQSNEGLLRRLVHSVVGGGSGSLHWYVLPGGHGPATSALDVGAPPGTDVYAPVNGTVVGIAKVILDGRALGERIDIQPTSAPSLVVSVSHLAADPSLAVGQIMSADASKIGVVLDFSTAERQALSRYTNDSGNHVLVEVHPSASLQAR